MKPVLKLLLSLAWCAALWHPGQVAGSGLTIQSSFFAQTNSLQFVLQGIDPNWVYQIESSSEPGRIPFSPVEVGRPGQSTFSVSRPDLGKNFYRATGTNAFGNRPIPTGAFSGPARHPALGYNSFQLNSTGITESLMVGITDCLATNGMAAAGYKYVVLDQGWSGNSRNPDGTPTISPSFPHGMAWLADYIHSKGLLMGLYTVTGSNFNGFIGSAGYFAEDAVTYSKWGVDYVKLDGGDFDRNNFEMFGNAWLSTGRPLWFAPTISTYDPWISNETSSWRGNGGKWEIADLHPWGVLYSQGYMSGWGIAVLHADYIAQYGATVGAGHWNDPDELDASVSPGGAPYYVGLAKPEMAIFSMLACNLMWDAIPPLQNYRMDTLYVMTNAEVLAIDQDALGIPGTVVSSNASGMGQVYARPLGTTNGNVKAVALLNRTDDQPQTITVNWTSLGLPNGPATVRDLFSHANLGIFTNSYTATVSPKDCELLTVTIGAPPFLHHGTNYLSDQGWLPGWTNASAGIYQIPGMIWPSKDISESKTPISINHQVYSKGIGMLANGRLQFALSGLATRFHAEIGIDDVFTTRSQAGFMVYVDGTKVFDSGLIINGSPTQFVDVDVTGGQILTLQIMTLEPDGLTINDSCDWANACVICP